MATEAEYMDDSTVQFPRDPMAVEYCIAEGIGFFKELRESSQDGFAGIDAISDDRLADSLALVLNEFCKTSPEPPCFPDPHDPAALFFSPSKQTSFTLNFYCKRLLDYTCCSKSCFVVAILYLVRLSERCPIFELNDFNVHRLICTAVVLAAKWLDDVSYSNSHYARVGGIQTAAEMSRLEEHMLRSLDFRLFITKEKYEEVETNFLLIAANCI